MLSIVELYRITKTGATNQNAPRLISAFFCMLCQKNESNALTVLKKQKELADKEQREECVISRRAFRLV